MKRINFQLAFVLMLAMFGICNLSYTFLQDYPIPSVIERIVKKIYSNNDVDRFKIISQNDILQYIDSKDAEILAKSYWTFDVNTDVVVYVCRDIKQVETPYWLKKNGFERTKEQISNENVNYEVWSKVFKAGKVELGINGFDRHRYTYFVVVKSLSANSKLKITPIWPLKQNVQPLKIGSVIYKDWDELVVSQLSSALDGGYILSTYRGRSREANLMNAFRFTDYPSSSLPDQILLSWTANPLNSQHISWRTSKDINSCAIRYWKRGDKDTLTQIAKSEVIHDVLLANNPIIKRYHVDLVDLYPASNYEYEIVADKAKSKVYTFNTANPKADFEFGWFGDMHNDPQLQTYIPNWQKAFPNASFYLQVGDLVGTGLFRDNWDQLWAATKSITDQKPFMAVPGNHDSQEALFPWMYLSFLKYPTNGPSNLPKGLSYSFVYNNALFLMLDGVTFSAEEQQAWIEQTLASSKEKFKIVCFHFAPYTFESTYENIINSWEPLFIKYDVDVVFNGHFHYYHKTLEAQQPKYIMSIATNAKGENITVKEGEYFNQTGYLYNHVKVGKEALELITVDTIGRVIDQFKITKN